MFDRAAKLVALVGFLWLSLATATSSAVRADDAASITLAHQTLALEVDQTLAIQLIVTPALTAASQITVSAYQPITARKDFTAATRHSFAGQLVDQFMVDPSTVAAPAADGSVTIEVPTESTAGTAGSLRLPTAGVYPLLIDIHTGSAHADLVTFVDRLASPGDPAVGSLAVAVVASVSAPPQIPGDTPSVPVATADDVQKLLGYRTTDGATNDAATGAANASPLPLTIAMSPELLDRLPADQVDQLQALLGDSDNRT
ncbi:MAG TPA: hypothetical protein VGM78_06290, partial [Ilumatobacteraceae bacterium]